ncbi:hypothetical protein [Protaetiibacter intestinalis]|uniref:Large exoprotein n=1 Tax=Protaetiibacter intestinalis TaxID=2419774 RepID=A0A387B8Q9_9MICO|nr:hypothetical protein [Protaetiibacter intestinalis]AYF97359.1 hypothetical protein D7I47_03215 [Protaetiibacter intestinalis]
MDFSGAGTAIMLALAAVLWFLYLLPTWVRRREYLATERNATRLQRAIRVMAESAEVPEEVHLEASARAAAQQERLRTEERRREDAAARAEVHAAALRAREAERRAAVVERAQQLAERRPETATPLDRLRRARRVAGLLLLATVLVGGVQLWLIATTGMSVGAWVVLAGCVAGGLVSTAIQRRIVERTRALAAPAAPVARTASVLLDAEPIAEPVREWTPVPVPKPLYLEHQQAPREPVMPAVSAETLLRAAAEEAERALAAAHAEPEVVPFPQRQAPAASAAPAPSRFASMGIVGDVDAALPDLDEVLRRRRLG